MMLFTSTCEGDRTLTRFDLQRHTEILALSTYYYHSSTKLRACNVFTRVCLPVILSVHRDGLCVTTTWTCWNLFTWTSSFRDTPPRTCSLILHHTETNWEAGAWPSTEIPSCFVQLHSGLDQTVLLPPAGIPKVRAHSRYTQDHYIFSVTSCKICALKSSVYMTSQAVKNLQCDVCCGSERQKQWASKVHNLQSIREWRAWQLFSTPPPDWAPLKLTLILTIAESVGTFKKVCEMLTKSRTISEIELSQADNKNINKETKNSVEPWSF